MFAVAKSGTISLEICNANIPSIIIYKMNVINFFIIKILVKVKSKNAFENLKNQKIRDLKVKLKFFQRKSTRYIVPLRFSFNKTPGLAIPIFLTGIDKTEFEIEVKFKSLANLLVHDGGTVNSTSIAEFQAFGTYYSLEN